MRILSLDPGEAWIGTALSDGLGYTCKPYQTTTPSQLHTFLKNFFTREYPDVQTIVIGRPTTVRGGESAQTEKVKLFAEELRLLYPTKTFVLWDERYSSARAETVQKNSGKNTSNRNSKEAIEQKMRSHSIAAAFILQSYLDYQANQRNLEDEQQGP